MWGWSQRYIFPLAGAADITGQPWLDPPWNPMGLSHVALCLPFRSCGLSFTDSDNCTDPPKKGLERDPSGAQWVQTTSYLCALLAIPLNLMFRRNILPNVMVEIWPTYYRHYFCSTESLIHFETSLNFGDIHFSILFIPLLMTAKLGFIYYL